MFVNKTNRNSTMKGHQVQAENRTGDLLTVRLALPTRKRLKQFVHEGFWCVQFQIFMPSVPDVTEKRGTTVIIL